MLFAEGTRVRFKHTGDEGVVSALLDNGMVNVHLDDDDMIIPAFVDDLENIEDKKRERLQHKPKIKAKVVSGKKSKELEKPKRPTILSQYAIIKSLGIQLAFDPEYQRDGTLRHYAIHLLNDTHIDVIFTFRLSIYEQVKQKVNGKLESVSSYYIGDLLFDQLNDNPLVEIECWPITTQGTGKRMQKRFRIKPQQFFKKIITAPILNKKVHHYRIFDQPGIAPNEAGRSQDIHEAKCQTTLAQRRPLQFISPTRHSRICKL